MPLEQEPGGKAAAQKSGGKAAASSAEKKPAAAKRPAANKTTAPKGAGFAVPEAGKSEAKTGPAGREAEIKERAAAALAAAQAAQEAREQARIKREAVRRHSTTGPAGSIYAAAVREGAQTPPEDLLPPRQRATGSIYAAAVREGIIQTDLEATPTVNQPPRTEAEPPAEAQAAAEPPAPDAEAEAEPRIVLEGVDLPPELLPSVVTRTAAMKPPPRFGKVKKAKPAKPKTPPPHKREKEPRPQSAGAVAASKNPAIRAIGNVLYALGFYAECRLVQIWRVLRDVGLFLGQLLAWVFGGMLSSLGRMLAGFFRDLVAPFVRFAQGLGHVRDAAREEKKKGGSGVKAAARHFGGGIKRHGHLVARLTGFIAPLAAAMLLGFVVWTVAGADYGLSVQWQGQRLGTIIDQTVLDDAKTILRGRLRLSRGQSAEDWSFSPDLTVARSVSFTSKDQLVNQILRSSSADIVEGTGLYIGESKQLVAVTTEGERLSEFLDNMLEEQSEQEGRKAEFVKPVECDFEAGEVFLQDSVQTYDEIVELLTGTVSEEQHYTVQEGDTLGTIAHEHNLLLETLLARNPQFEGEEPDFAPDAGTSMLIRRAQPYLQVQTVERRVSEEPIPFEEVRQETDDLPLSLERFEQRGEDGLQRVYDDYIYVGGELVDIQREDEMTTVLQEPVPQLTLVGTYDFSDREQRDYNPAYMWPLPDYTYSSRGGGPGMGHRGRDINAPAGTPIFAANAGTVITAGTHWSYGNYIVIDHQDGLRTLYAHCTTLLVTEGEYVKQGQYIATVGNTGFSFGNHLHLEFQTNGGQLLQPDDYVSPPRGYDGRS